jgi:hypothetical protein
MCETHAYASAVLVRAEPLLPTGEVVIDWSDGVMSMEPADAAARIEALDRRRARGAERGKRRL